LTFYCEKVTLFAIRIQGSEVTPILRMQGNLLLTKYPYR